MICESPELEIGLSDVVVNGRFACDVQRFDAPQKLKTLDRVSVRWKTLDGFVAVLHFRILFKVDLVVAELSLQSWLNQATSIATSPLAVLPWRSQLIGYSIEHFQEINQKSTQFFRIRRGL